MIETCQTNPNCEIKPSNCEYAVRCTTYEDLSENKEVYVCGRNNCKEIRCEMQKISVGDIVCKTNSYWKGELGEPPLSEEDKKEKFKVVAISRLGCQIESLETGHTSAWWGFDCLKLVESDKEVWEPIDRIREYGNQVDFVEPYSMEI